MNFSMGMNKDQVEAANVVNEATRRRGKVQGNHAFNMNELRNMTERTKARGAVQYSRAKRMLTGERAIKNYKRVGIGGAGVAGAYGLYEGGKYLWDRHRDNEIPPTGSSY